MPPEGEGTDSRAAAVSEAMTETMQRVVLARDPVGAPQEEDFRLEQMSLPAVADGRFLIRNLYVAADPGRLPAVGAVVESHAIGRVIDSRNLRYPVGTLVVHGGGWATHAIASGRGYCHIVPDLGVRESPWLGILGAPGMTAWFGLRRVAAILPHDRLLITAAASPVGAAAGQMARRMGAGRLVGLAATDDERNWLRQVAGFDAALDSGSDTLVQDVRDALPDGIDILFDSAGIALAPLLSQMRLRGRILLAGAPDDDQPFPAGGSVRDFVSRRLRMEGMVVLDDIGDLPPAQAEVAQLLRDGLIHQREIIGQGLASLIPLFCNRTTDGSFGQRLAHLSSEAT